MAAAPSAPTISGELPETFVDAPADEGAQDLLKRLQAQTEPMRRQGSRPPLYNAPDLWYARPDGDIVRLPGDALAQAYYRSKGFHILTRQEVREWEGGVRALVIAEQRKRAAAITTLRRLADKHPGIEIAGDLEVTPTDELMGMLETIRQQTGGAVQVIQGRFREQEDVGDPEGYRDVEVASGEDLERKLAADARRRGGGRGSAFTGNGSQV